MRRNGVDCIFWEGGGDDLSTVKAFSNAILLRWVVLLPSKPIWVWQVSPRVSLFAWITLWRQNLTTDNLKIRVVRRHHYIGSPRY